jgi:hypothetical protein
MDARGGRATKPTTRKRVPSHLRSNEEKKTNGEKDACAKIGQEVQDCERGGEIEGGPMGRGGGREGGGVLGQEETKEDVWREPNKLETIAFRRNMTRMKVGSARRKHEDMKRRCEE